MSRPALRWDRFVVAVVGALLVLTGVWLALWSAERLPAVSPDPGSLVIGGLRGVPEREWWPWALGGAGVVASLLALWWLVAHVGHDRVSQLSLPGDGSGGRLDIDAGSVAARAADAIAATAADVRSGSGTVRREGKQLVMDLVMTLEPRATLSDVVRTVEQGADDARTSLERPDLLARTRLAVAGRERAPSRVV